MSRTLTPARDAGRWRPRTLGVPTLRSAAAWGVLVEDPSMSLSPNAPTVGSASLSLVNYLRKEGGGVIGADQKQVEQFLRSHESEIKALLKNVGIVEWDPGEMAAAVHQTAKALGTLPAADPLAQTVV